MHILRTLFFCGFVALTVAQSSVLFFTRVPNPITDGEAAVILWSTNDTDTAVTLTLLRGTSKPYDTVDVITSNAQDGQYIWRPPVWIANGDDYRLEISQDSQVNTFGPLAIQGAIPSAVRSESIAASVNASISRSISASISAANATANVTVTVGGGRNTTTSRQTTPKATDATTTSGIDPPSKDSKTGAAASSSTSPAAAPSDYTMTSSALALTFGAIAALFYLQ